MANHAAGGPRSRGRAPSRKRSEGDQRLFVAAYPPLELIEALQARVTSLDLPPHRLTPAEQVHLTLHFVGETPRKDIENVLESIENATSGVKSCRLQVESLSRLPTRGLARLIAAETDAPAPLLELHDRLVGGLDETVKEKGSSRYRPHLTLCRFRSPCRVHLGDDAALDDLGLAFCLEEVVVVRSVLQPKGAEHHRIASFALAKE